MHLGLVAASRETHWQTPTAQPPLHAMLECRTIPSHMLYASFTTDDLIRELRELRRKTGWPERTDGPWALLDRITRAERELRMRGIDPDAIDAETKPTDRR